MLNIADSLAEGSAFELPVPVSKVSDGSIMLGYDRPGGYSDGARGFMQNGPHGHGG